MEGGPELGERRPQVRRRRDRDRPRLAVRPGAGRPEGEEGEQGGGEVAQVERSGEGGTVPL